jgi:hypothetical protein
MDHDVTDDVLILLADILGTCERVFARADCRDVRLARIRRLGNQLHDLVLEQWAEAATHALRDHEHDDTYSDDFGDDDIPF